MPWSVLLSRWGLHWVCCLRLRLPSEAQYYGQAWEGGCGSLLTTGWTPMPMAWGLQHQLLRASLFPPRAVQLMPIACPRGSWSWRWNASVCVYWRRTGSSFRVNMIRQERPAASLHTWYQSSGTLSGQGMCGLHTLKRRGMTFICLCVGLIWVVFLLSSVFHELWDCFIFYSVLPGVWLSGGAT